MSLVPHSSSSSSSSSSLALLPQSGISGSSDQQQQEEETKEFPSVCSKCIGPNPFIKMIRHNMDAECKMCNRVFTVFRWKRDRGSRYMKTMICPVCSALKNVCQSCLIDLEFGLPAYVRDNVLNNVVSSRDASKSEFSKTMEADMVDRMMREGGVNQHIITRGAATRSEQVLKFARSQPYTVQRLRRPLKAPEDTSIRTLYVGGIDDGSRGITQDDLRAVFSQYGAVRSIRMVQKQACAFVTFVHRSDAETAADALQDNLVIRGSKLRIMWARPKPRHSQQQQHQAKHQQQQQQLQLQQQLQQQQYATAAAATAATAATAGIPQPPPFFIPSTGIDLGPVPGTEEDRGGAVYASLLAAKKSGSSSSNKDKS